MISALRLPDPPPRSPALRTLPGLGCALLLLLAAAGAATAQDTEELRQDRADQVKAAFLYNFTKFVSWPDSAFKDEQAPIVVAIVGRGRFGAVAEQRLAGKISRGRAIRVRRFEPPENGSLPPEAHLRSCHLVFVNESESERYHTVLQRLKKADVLTVSDIPAFAEGGGMIELALEAGRYVIRINRKAAEATSLHLSAKLMRLARIVEPKAPGNAEGVDDRVAGGPGDQGPPP